MTIPYDIVGYGLVLGIILTLLVIWVMHKGKHVATLKTRPAKEELTPPDNASAQELLDYHVKRNPQNSLSQEDFVSAKSAVTAAAAYR